MRDVECGVRMLMVVCRVVSRQGVGRCLGDAKETVLGSEVAVFETQAEHDAQQ